MTLKGTGWSYFNNGSFCRTCNKRTSYKPINCSSAGHINYYTKNILLKMNKLSRIRNIKIHKDIIMYYGGKCTCCGYNNFDKQIHGKRFLQIDHINGGGNKERKRLGGSLILYALLRKANYPPGYRVLCRSCNNGMEPEESICELHKWEASIK